MACLVSCCLLRAAPARAGAPAAADSALHVTVTSGSTSFLPLLGDEARKRGIELPLPFGAGAVYYHLSRDIAVSDVRVGRNGSTPASVSRFATFGAVEDVENVNLKFDAWILPFVNVYAIVGYIWNSSATNVEVQLPPIFTGGGARTVSTHVETKLEGSVGGLGVTLAGGYGPWFMTYDANFDQADLGFDDRFKAVVTSIRGGWNGHAGMRPLRVWANATDWNTFATATGTVPDPAGGTLSFEVDQGPAYRYTFGSGAMTSLHRNVDLAGDVGWDFHGGWYVALVPVFRF